jgi:chlorite dismutase
VALRGTYDTTGYRADADLLVWLAAPAPEALQDALSEFRRTPLGSALVPVWSAFGVHGQSDLGNRGAPAYFRGEAARRYVCVCSINHTSDWHALPAVDRRRLQADGDRAYKHHAQVIASAVGAFGLGDSESILAIESHELAGIVDLMRDVGAADNRRYISGPLSFFTGVRKPLAEIVEALP